LRSHNRLCDRREVHGAKAGNTFSELAYFPAQSRQRHRRHRHVRCGVRIVSAAVRDHHSGARSQENHSTAVTQHPTAAWRSRQITEAFPWDTAPLYLLRDRDASYGSYFSNRVEAMGITQVVTAPRSPWQNAYVERVIGSIRRECLDHIVIFNECHLKESPVLVRRLLSTHPHASVARQGLPRPASNSAAQNRKTSRTSEGRRLASSLRTPRRLIRPGFLLNNRCAADHRHVTLMNRETSVFEEGTQVDLAIGLLLRLGGRGSLTRESEQSCATSRIPARERKNIER
jgi:hypothetical protein